MSKFMEFSFANGNFLEMKEVWGAISNLAINAWNEFGADNQARLTTHPREPRSIHSFPLSEGIFGIAQIGYVDQDEIVGKIKLMDSSEFRLNNPDLEYYGHHLIGTVEFFLQKYIKTIVADPDVHPNIAVDERYIEKIYRVLDLPRITLVAS